MAEERLISLDAFRGMTIAGMILVNNPGSWENVYPPLRHADWHGWTPTDLVFPFFLFIVGVSLSLSLSKRKHQEPGGLQLYAKIFRRTLILFALGLLLNLIPAFDFNSIRLPGVLQRIALCYLVAALLFLKTTPRTRILIGSGILVFYWLILTFFPVPGVGAGILTLKGNICAYIDTKLLAGHLYTPGFDPEGILSTLPAIATTLIGTLCGDWLRHTQRSAVKFTGLLVSGTGLVLLGYTLHAYFPINKQLWTSTYVLFTAGAALIVLGMCFGLIDSLGYKKWALPFLVFGGNAIAVYLGSSLLARIIVSIKIPDTGGIQPLKAILYKRFFSTWAGDYLGSLLFPVAVLLIWFLIMLPLYRKNIHLKI
ncbi:acyltransferase family protein [Acidobacteriota bacterium]